MAFVLLLLGSCRSDHAPEALEYADDRAEQVFVKAYETLTEKYIEAVDPADLGLRGMAGLSSLDPAFVTRREGGMLVLVRGNEELARIAAPDAADIVGWSHATARIIDAAREVSPLVASASAEEIYAAVLGGAVAPLDRHTKYAGLRSARDYRAQREGFGGIGIRLNFDHSWPQIIDVLHDTPAEANQLRAGDILLEVDGESVEGLDRDAVIWRLRGEVGSSVSLTVARKDRPEPLTMAFRRALIVSPTVHLTTRHGYAVIALTGFNQRTARNLVRALRDAQNAKEKPKGIVLDLRGNPGGLLDQAVAVADAFLGDGRIVSTRGRHPDSFQLFDARGRDLAQHLPVVVLINGQSASAAEIVASALQDQGRAVVVGSNSYGKGSVQNITRLPNDGELIVTWSRFHAPSGYALENLGVVPNFCTGKIAPTLLRSAAAGTAKISMKLAQRAAEASVTLAAWRTHSGYDAESARALRERCPRRTEKPEEDFEVAEQVLADSRLYSRAIAASQPVLARSKD